MFKKISLIDPNECYMVTSYNSDGTKDDYYMFDMTTPYKHMNYKQKKEVLGLFDEESECE